MILRLQIFLVYFNEKHTYAHNTKQSDKQLSGALQATPFVLQNIKYQIKGIFWNERTKVRPKKKCRMCKTMQNVYKQCRQNVYISYHYFKSQNLFFFSSSFFFGKVIGCDMTCAIYHSEPLKH